MVVRFGLGKVMSRLLGLASGLLALTACSGVDPVPAVVPESAHLSEIFSDLGEACPGRAQVAETMTEREQLFVEAALVDVPSELAGQASLSNLQALARSPQAQLVGAPHVIGDFDARAEMELGLAPASPTPSLYRWSMVPRHADADVSSVELELELNAPGQPDPTSRKSLRFSVSARDNEPRLAHVLWDESHQRSLLVLFRTFRIHGEADLRFIFQCKMQQRAKHLQRLRARSATSL